MNRIRKDITFNNIHLVDLASYSEIGQDSIGYNELQIPVIRTPSFQIPTVRFKDAKPKHFRFWTHINGTNVLRSQYIIHLS